MMRKIKKALIWLFGALYASAWWVLLSEDLLDIPMYLVIPAKVIVVVGSLGIVIQVVFFFCDYWNSDA